MPFQSSTLQAEGLLLHKLEASMNLNNKSERHRPISYSEVSLSQTACWGVLVEIVYSLASISASSTDLGFWSRFMGRFFRSRYSGISEQIKPLQHVDQVAEFKFESKFESLLVICQSLPKTIPLDNRRF